MAAGDHNDAYRIYREHAERMAIEAGALLTAAYGHVEAREKGPGDLVTDADQASQQAIGQSIARAFPDHTLLAEEDGVTPDPSKPWRWVVDPLDGTTNFAHGFPLWCVSIALEHEGRLVVGVVHAPLLGTTYSASLGRGTTVNRQPLRVSRVERLTSSLISAGLPANFGPDAERQLAYMGRFSTGTHSLRRTGSSAWNLAQVAAGGCDVFYATSISPWDVAAGVLLVHEAGGLVTHMDGAPYDLYGPGILASNGRVHAEAVRAVGEAWPRSV
ncbi:MAG TPA: inositol monophosphatase family protein [Isosphaeraceae bacterium]|jgi:myo-inositol-1(or 4)-monophosphatase|nr:inositol monophosphatase family protein [Isosphaeraceae bacterium]